MGHTRKRIWITVCFLLTSAGCHREGPLVFSAVAGPRIICSQSAPFFPGSIGGAAPLFFGTDQAEWESMYLQRMQEPSLYRCPGSRSDADLRFLWDRSLSPPIAARLVIHQNRTGTLFLHMLAHPAMPPPPPPGGKSISADDRYQQTLDRQISITREQAQRVVQMVSNIDFTTNHSGPQTTDGSDWIFETEEAGHYQVVDFRNNPPDGARKLGLFLVMDLGGLTLEHSAIY